MVDSQANDRKGSGGLGNAKTVCRPDKLDTSRKSIRGHFPDLAETPDDFGDRGRPFSQAGH